MKKIVFIGKFFPEVCYESLFNYLIIREMKSSGNYVILISDSWNRCHGNNFIGKEENASDIIDEYYYLDPVQLNYSDYNINVGLIAMVKKVLKFQEVDMVMTSNIIDYSLVMAYIKEKFSLKVSLIVNDRTVFRFINDDYTGEIAPELIGSYDKIIASGQFVEYLKVLAFIEKSKIFKKDIQNYAIDNEKSDFTLIFGVVDNTYFVDNLNEYIKHTKQKLLIVIYGIDREEYEFKLVNKENVDIKSPSHSGELVKYLANAKQVIDCHYFSRCQTLEDYNCVLRKYNNSVMIYNENCGYEPEVNAEEADVI